MFWAIMFAMWCSRAACFSAYMSMHCSSSVVFCCSFCLRPCIYTNVLSFCSFPTVHCATIAKRTNSSRRSCSYVPAPVYSSSCALSRHVVSLKCANALNEYFAICALQVSGSGDSHPRFPSLFHFLDFFCMPVSPEGCHWTM